ESHLGVAEQHGVMSLARRYGLTHTLLVLLGVGLLFVWRNNASLIPAAPPDAGEVRAAEAVEAIGHESATGFVNLLSRTIGARRLFETSLAEFRRSVAWRRLTPESQQALDALAARQPAKPDPVVATREAHALLARSRH